MEPGKLPTYKGYTVDYRIKEFRKCTPCTCAGNCNPFDHPIEFIPFSSDEGDELLAEMIEKDLVPEHILINLF